MAIRQSNLQGLSVVLNISGTLPVSPILVVVLSEAQACGISITGIAASNSAGGMEILFLCSVCLVCVAASESSWSLVQSIPTVCVNVCVCVCVCVCDPET